MSNDSHMQMIRQGGISESEALWIWNAIDFLQCAFQDQPELVGSRSMESLFCTGTALYDAAKRLVPYSGNAVAATERGLEYAPLIASALVECVFFDAGVPGPLRKAHELWTTARVDVCKKHVAGRQFEAQRSAASSAEPDERSLAVLVTMAAMPPSQSGSLPPMTGGPAATPMALMAAVVVVVGVIMTVTPAMLTAAHGGG